MKKDGTRVDAKDLTEKQIIGLIESDVRDIWTPSYEALLQIAGMEQQYGNIISDVMGSVDKYDVRRKARTIASFQKQSSGDFSQVTTDEITGIIQQTVYNEQMKKQQSGMRR